MMKEEFEKLAGYEVSNDDYYGVIEPMYMSTTLDKSSFVMTLNKKRFALKPKSKIKKEMRECAGSLKETCTHYADYETMKKLSSLCREYINRFYGDNCAYYINEEMMQSCFYPVSVDIYCSISGEVFETIVF